jgi:hypothetical protein
MNCPNCKIDLNRHIEIGGHDKPEEGDLCVCAHCATIIVVEATTVRAVIRSDIELLSPQEAYQLGNYVGLVLKRIAEARKALAECDGV